MRARRLRTDPRAGTPPVGRNCAVVSTFMQLQSIAGTPPRSSRPRAARKWNAAPLSAVLSVVLTYSTGVVLIIVLSTPTSI